MWSNDPNSPPHAPLHWELILQEALLAANPPVAIIKGVRIRFAPGQPTFAAIRSQPRAR